MHEGRLARDYRHNIMGVLNATKCNVKDDTILAVIDIIIKKNVIDRVSCLNKG